MISGALLMLREDGVSQNKNGQRRNERLEYARAFLMDLKYVAMERADAVMRAVREEWEYYVLRSKIWRDYNELVASNFDEEYGRYESNIDPQDLNEAENYLKVIQTNKLRRKAQQLNILMPDESVPDNYYKISWDFDPNRPSYLSQKGLEKILPAIRAAQKERREAAGFWFGIIVGVLGAVTGLVAVLS